MRRRIEELKAERDAVVLAHYYVPDEVQDCADYVGDSFYLARLAVKLPQRTVVLAGVEFMGESVKLLNPKKTVLLPEPHADCPMAHMVSRETVERARERYGDDLAVVCYVNSTIRIKSWSDVCVTSSNAVKIVRALPQQHILFIPDRNLGRYVAECVPEKHIIFNEGACPRHDEVSVQVLRAARELHPQALFLAHPECTSDVLELCDFIGSTSELIDYAEQSSARDFVVVTVRGVLHEMRRRCPGKRFYTLTPPLACADMESVTLEKVLSCLESATGEVDVPAACSSAAARALERMLALASAQSEA